MGFRVSDEETLVLEKYGERPMQVCVGVYNVHEFC